MLSFVAGMVNITGVLAVYTLTTNVTGHFAFFSEEFVLGDYELAITYVSYICAFLSGAILCGFLVELLIRHKPAISHAIPMGLEISILVFVSLATDTMTHQWAARALLFAMGLQNALVTKISRATVRTTHLTGLFTDLGIEISQLIFYRGKTESKKLSRSIYLRLAIILFFFFGGVFGGFVFNSLQIKTLIVAALSLLLALAYDTIRFGFHHYSRKFRSKPHG